MMQLVKYICYLIVLILLSCNGSDKKSKAPATMEKTYTKEQTLKEILDDLKKNDCLEITRILPTPYTGMVTIEFKLDNGI